MSSKPIAVITGDLHFTPNTLELASEVVRQMKVVARKHGIPIILNGDTLDTKAIMRGEVVNKLIELVNDSTVKFIINVGNHDKISEKSDEHTLHFLKSDCLINDDFQKFNFPEYWMIPYYSDKNQLLAALNKIPKGSTLIMHQGVETAHMGHYLQDTTSLPKEAFADYRVIASHYHRRQDIKCGRPKKGAVGLFSYLGSPYTQSFGEANDGPKGFSVLCDNGLLEFVPTNLRQHVIIETDVNNNYSGELPNPEDLVWVKLTGSKSALAKVDKQELGVNLLGRTNFKLDLIPIEDNTLESASNKGTPVDMLDNLIDGISEPPEYRAYLKTYYKELLNENS